MQQLGGTNREDAECKLIDGASGVGGEARRRAVQRNAAAYTKTAAAPRSRRRRRQRQRRQRKQTATQRFDDTAAVLRRRPAARALAIERVSERFSFSFGRRGANTKLGSDEPPPPSAATFHLS